MSNLENYKPESLYKTDLLKNCTHAENRTLFLTMRTSSPTNRGHGHSLKPKAFKYNIFLLKSFWWFKAIRDSGYCILSFPETFRGHRWLWSCAIYLTSIKSPDNNTFLINYLMLIDKPSLFPVLFLFLFCKCAFSILTLRSPFDKWSDCGSPMRRDEAGVDGVSASRNTFQNLIVLNL